MLTGEPRPVIDIVWNAFWANGIAYPMVFEQIIYLLFIRGPDDDHTLRRLSLTMFLDMRTAPIGLFDLDCLRRRAIMPLM